MPSLQPKQLNRMTDEQLDWVEATNVKAAASSAGLAVPV